MAHLGLGAIALFVPGLAAPSAAQPIDAPYLVRDIAGAAPDPHLSSYLQFEAVVGDRAVFWVGSDSPGSRWTLWSTDGTSGGTSPISDLLSYEATTSLTSVPLCVDSERWIFWPGGERAAFWSTDGSVGGTSMMTPLSRNSRPSMNYADLMPCEERQLDGRIHFWTTELQGLDGPTYELWSTDGTFDGTHRVAYLGQDLVYVGGGLPDFIRLGDKFLFSLSTAPNGFELWRTDGTEAGTGPFLSQISGTQILMARGFSRVGAWAFFVGFNPSEPSPAPLAVTDGTAAGTRVFENLLPVEGSYPEGYEPVALPDRLVVAATSGGPVQLWGVSPTELDPEMLTSFTSDGSIGPLVAQPIGNRALFVASFPSPPHDTRSRLFISDGTSAGTIEAAVGCDPTGSCGIGGIGIVGGKAYFSVSHATGFSFWKTDGTVLGTVEVRSFTCSSPCGFLPFGSSGQKMYLRAGFSGSELALWVTDGTSAGTFELLPPGSLGNLWTLDFDTLALPGDRLLFGAQDEAGFEPWITDGTPNGTHALVNLSSQAGSSVPQRMVPNGGRVLFSAETPGFGIEPWVSDGTPAGTNPVVEDVLGGVDGSVQPLAAADSEWPLLLDLDANGPPYDLFATNGEAGNLTPLGLTAERGTAIAFNGSSLISTGSALIRFDGDPPRLLSLAETGSGFGISNFLATGTDRAYFRNHLAGGTHDLWATDATEAGTGPFCEAPSYFEFEAQQWIGELGDGVVFKAGAPGSTVRAYFCREGETAILLGDTVLGTACSDPDGFVAVGARSLFGATDSGGDRELWRTDGSVVGTELLANLSLTGSSNPTDFTALAGGVIFTADDGLHGRELWYSDGTPAGTHMLADIAPGPMSSRPSGFESIGGRLVFAAETLAGGRELWVTAGTPESTRALGEVRPGPLSSRPEELTTAGGRLFFRATDERGAELWALCPSWMAGSSESCNELFADGFEGGSADLWSASTP